MSLLRLPVEVLFLIFSSDCLTPRDLYQLLQTCWRTYESAILCLYRTVCISARPNLSIPGKPIITNLKGLLQCINQQPALASLVHAAELYVETDCPGRTIRMLKLLSKFTSIKTLSLAGAYVGCPTSYLVNDISAFGTLSRLRHMTLTAGHYSICPKDLTMLIGSVPNLNTFSLRQFDGLDRLKFPNGMPLNVTEMEFSESMQPPSGRQLKSFFTNHPALQTLTWTIITNILSSSQEWSPLWVYKALSPLKRQLISLCLTIVSGSPAGPFHSTKPQSQSLDRRMALDYSGFAMLKTLEIHDCFIFDKAFISRISRVDRPPVHNYKSYIGDLHERLPNHLETLKINFHSGSEVLEKVTKPEGQAEYSWLLALAHYKDESFRRLSRVDIVQIPHCNSQGVGAGADSNTSRIAAQEWKYPPDVVKAFRGAGIALKVMFRPKLQMRR